MAACLGDKAPISCNPAISAIAATGPTPGIEVRISRRLGEDGIACDQALDLDIEVGDRYLDSLELAFELRDQPLDHARAEAVKNDGPRGDGGIAAMHEFLQGLDKAGRRRGDAGAEPLAQDREHARVGLMP